MDCPTCSSTDREGTFRARHRVIVTCGQCALRFVDSPAPDAADLALEKLGNAFVETYIREEPSYRAYFQRKVSDLRRAGASGRVLDVGCATGVFLAAACRDGFEGTGLDLLPSAVDYARASLGVDARLTRLEDAKFATGEFDAVTLFQVIEHVPRPAELAREVARVLKPGGTLLLTTPDRRGLLARFLGRRWFEYFNEEHLTYFEKGSLRRLLAESGFEINSLRTEFGRSFSLGYVADRLSGFYYTDRSFQSRAARSFARLLRLAGGVTVSEPWQSLYAIARRT